MHTAAVEEPLAEREVVVEQERCLRAFIFLKFGAFLCPQFLLAPERKHHIPDVTISEASPHSQ